MVVQVNLAFLTNNVVVSFVWTYLQKLSRLEKRGENSQLITKFNRMTVSKNALNVIIISEIRLSYSNEGFTYIDLVQRFPNFIDPWPKF